MLSFFSEGGFSAGKVLKALAGQLGDKLPMASNSCLAGALASQWRGPAKRSAMQSIADRYFAEVVAYDSVGVIATRKQGEEQGMTTATWNGATIVESDKTAVVETERYGT